MERSKLVSISIKNLGCIGPEGLKVDLDNILCLVGANNTGKSTILKAYELALGTIDYKLEFDLCKRSNGNNTIIELELHIPEGVPNIAEKWKEVRGDVRIVKSKWEWDSEGIKTRQTWDPELGEYADDGNAAGLDNVFKSRLPKPLRIGALEEPNTAIEKLKKILLEPIAEELNTAMEDDESEVKKALNKFIDLAKLPIAIKQRQIDEITQSLTSTHGKIFPSLGIEFNAGIEDINFKPIQALLSGSTIRFKEWDQEIDWINQGTGSRRALFWSILQVWSKFKALSDMENDIKKQITKNTKEIQKIEKNLETIKQQAAIDRNKEKLEGLVSDNERLKKIIPEQVLSEEDDELQLPGNMLLIDEPEIALHPNAIRAASDYLYELSHDPSWQVILTTHSPQFIDPFQDHTTIVRLSRDKESLTPKTYRSDEIDFSPEDKENLKMLNSFDTGLSEMFFGQYPIIIEGDTEYAAFDTLMRLFPEKYPVIEKPVLVRARGKYNIVLVIKILTHFKIGFSVLHDLDYPFLRNGNKNSAWPANEVIYKEIQKARQNDIKIIHRFSLSDFEKEHIELKVDEAGNVMSINGQDKPWFTFYHVINSSEVQKSVERKFNDLINLKSQEEPFDENDFLTGLPGFYSKWVDSNKIKDNRYKVK